jgi:hypothetical protein
MGGRGDKKIHALYKMKNYNNLSTGIAQHQRLLRVKVYTVRLILHGASLRFYEIRIVLFLH